jgi:hypothetical protein
MRKNLTLVLIPAVMTSGFAADLPVREVVLFKHGVAYFSRGGDLPPGETAQLAFKASEMNDVLKSLTIVDASGQPIAGVRYDASEPVEERLAQFPFAVGAGASLTAFLDQMKGARLEIGNLAGSIVSARVTNTGEAPRQVERELVVLLTDSGELRTVDLATAQSVRLSDAKLQTLLRDYLAIANGAHSRDRRNVFIDASKQGARRVTASYMTPSAVWKSSYRLIFGANGDPTLEGWAIVDNTSGDDWTNVNLAVVSGRPISFISELYEPKYVERPIVELAENRAVAPKTFEGAVQVGLARGGAAGVVGGVLGGVPPPSPMYADAISVTDERRSTLSSIDPGTQGREVGDLFEYRFQTPVTVKKGESAMLPFLQQKLGARKLLIYSNGMGLNPMNAAELTNSTGKTLDGGPITVYDASSYAGEALVETLKVGDKRIISYGVDLGTRLTTKFDSSNGVTREVHVRQGVITAKTAYQETTTFTINNVDAMAKTLLIERPLRQGYTLLSDLKPKETTANLQRYEVLLAPKATTSFVVREERVLDQSTRISNESEGVLRTWVQNRALSAAGRTALDRIMAKQRDVANVVTQQATLRNSINSIGTDQGRYRDNLTSLRGVAGQEQLVQQYARSLAESETRLTTLRDQEAQLQRSENTLRGELAMLIETTEF